MDHRTSEVRPLPAREARDESVEQLRLRILQQIEPLLRAVGVAPHQVRCRVRHDPDGLAVVVRGPIRLGTVRQAIGVRVMDAVRGSDRTLGRVTLDWGDEEAA